jgi:flagellar hook-associated protein 3 FlgL
LELGADQRLETRSSLTSIEDGLERPVTIEPAEAALKINDLMTQIETAYALTAKISQLSLVKYL